MRRWLERNINSSYLSFVVHLLAGASRLKNTSFFPLLFIVFLGTWLSAGLIDLPVASASWTKVMGVLIGATVTSVVFWLVTLAYTLVFYPFPVCANGKCHKMSDYIWSIGTIYGWEALGFHHYWCACGDEYVRLGRRRFARVSGNGEDCHFVPYKRLSGIREWVDDSEEIHIPAAHGE
ncbi:MAG: hypothetical protein WC655_25995 [Candidatus Hydrogenedentales bacterium]|jgi:hypothetical protein